MNHQLFIMASQQQLDSHGPDSGELMEDHWGKGMLCKLTADKVKHLSLSCF